MNARVIGLFLAGAAVGLGAGYLIWGAEEAPPPPPPPEMEVPWQEMPCPPGAVPPTTVGQICDAITALALAVQPPTPDSIYCAAKAQSVKAMDPADREAACARLEAAYLAAQAGDWETCRRELDMIE